MDKIRINLVGQVGEVIEFKYLKPLISELEKLGYQLSLSKTDSGWIFTFEKDLGEKHG